MLNSTIVANINGELSSNQKISGGLRSSSMIPAEFTMTEIKNNSASTDQRRFLQKSVSKGSPHAIFNGQSKANSGFLDQNRNPQSKLKLVNGNKNGVDSSEEGIPAPKVCLYAGKITFEWQQVYKIGAGLVNLGNTCFLNTVLQCLTYCPPLANYLLHDSDHASKCRLAGFCMMCELQQHIKKVISRSGDIMKPAQIYQKLPTIAKHFQYGRQEDAHEFLRYLIDNLWKSCLSNHEGYSKLDPASKETTVVNQIFGGYHRSQVTCLRCKEKSNTYDHFMDFMLDVKNVLTLEKALDKFIQPELLQNDNAYKCPQCKMKVSAQKKFTVFKAPNVATFQFKRFDYHRVCGGKITKHIAYPENLNLRPYMSNPKGAPVTYRLNAVLVHLGSTCNSGHYFCYVRNSNGFWYVMDDARVQQVSINQVLNQNAYVLFYIRLNSSEAVSTKKPPEHVPGNIKNGFVGSRHMASPNLVPRPSLSIKSNALPEISKLSVSPPANNLTNGASAKQCHKQQNTQPQKRGKISFSIGSVTNINSMKENLMLKLAAGNAKASPQYSKGIINGNTLVPYVEDSSEEEADDGSSEGEAKEKSQENRASSGTKTFVKEAVGTKDKDKSMKSPGQPVNRNGSHQASPMPVKQMKTQTSAQPTCEKVSVKKPGSVAQVKVPSSDEKPKGITATEKESSSKSTNSPLPSATPSNTTPSSVKVNATSTWNVAEINLQSPSIASGSSTTSVNSTTDWSIIEQQEASSKTSLEKNSVGSRTIARRPERTRLSTDEYHTRVSKLKDTPGVDNNATSSVLPEPPAAMETSEVKDDSQPSDSKLAKSVVTATAPSLCSPTMDKESSSTECDRRSDDVDSTSHANPVEQEVQQPFRNQPFHGPAPSSFLETKAAIFPISPFGRGSSSESKNSGERPVSDDTQNASAKRPARFFDYNENSNGPVPKKPKTDSGEREHQAVSCYNKLSENKRDSLQQNFRTSSKQVLPCSSKKHAESKDKYSKSAALPFARSNRTREHKANKNNDTDGSSSDQSSDSKYEYTWVEKKTGNNSNFKGSSKSPADAKSEGKKHAQGGREDQSTSRSEHNKGNVASELQRNSNYLFGADVGTWNNSRRSPAYENKMRHHSDDYNDEMDKGKERHRKKHHYDRSYYQGNPFQAFENDRRRPKPQFQQGKWRSDKYYPKNRYHHNNRYYNNDDDRHFKKNGKYFSRMHYNKHHHFHRH